MPAKYCLILAFFAFLCFNAKAQNRTIDININNTKGPLSKSFNMCVGAGRANEGLRADWQRQLTITQAECGFKYIRFHGLLSDDMGVYSEDKNGHPVYNWQYIDELFDFLQQIHMKPFVEVGFMPGALASGNKTIFWWKGNVTPPKDYQKWNDLIKALVTHWTQRYSQKEVASWYFEVWNEPNLKDGFFTGTQQDYFKLYKETAMAIKSVSASYRVGGPATAGNAWVPETIAFCIQQEAPIDFISTHDYGVKQGFLDEKGNTGTILSRDRNLIANDMHHVKQQIQNSALPNLELHYTEWSASYTPSDPIHDSYHEAAFILNTIKHAAPYVNSMSYWTFTDIFEEAGPRTTPFHGGFGLINYQDIKKPAYYAFKYLNELGDTELQSADSSAIICKDAKNNVQVLVWDFTIDHPGDSVNNQVFYKRNLPAKSLPPTHLKIGGLKPGKYTLSIYKTGYQANDPYTAYFKLGSPSQLTIAQVKLLKQGSGAPIEQVVVNVSSSGSFGKELNIRQNDVLLIKLDRVKQ
ncbi:GH39 family glycosyl hydrolase [Mucilaginibacter polytrichastri]|uniref:Beta-xylosidase n=1 Tax=Mucilaginibacter polytrichastri TaxID=1302689 RepID=A0A1Q5ZSN3_9SPHI|nr:glycoside hydrolase [Mucilaginibacter polytrichastri]OKS84781.1 Beta-xylosidase [Mucilaginibacter polytrichastri]SFT00380.1 xylan 1,4-beta-xylosidase [Mucilaginibacter polytrichastri]